MAVTPVDIAGAYTKGLQVNQMRQEMEAQKAQQQERNAMRALYEERFGGGQPAPQQPMPAAPGGQLASTAPGASAAAQPRPQMSNQDFTNRVVQITGDPEKAMEWNSYFNSRDETGRAQDAAEAPLFVAALEGVQDQASYDQARQWLTSRGVDVSDMAPQYNRETTNMALQYARYLGNITPKGPEPTQLAKLQAELAALPAGDPRRAAYEDAIRKATTNAPQTQVSVRLPPEQSEEAKAVGKFYGETFTNLQQGAMDARTQNARLDRMEQLLEDVSTGKTAPTTQAIKATAKSAGIDLEALGITDDVGPAEAATALSNQMALQLRNPAGGAGMPGALSDADRQFLQSMVPGLANSPEGRRLMVETQKRLNERSIEVARMARTYRKEHGQLDEGFFDDLDAHSAANPLFEGMAQPQQQDIPPPEQRTIGGFYQTPKGRAMWTGERWIPEGQVPGGGGQ